MGLSEPVQQLPALLLVLRVGDDPLLVQLGQLYELLCDGRSRW